MNGSSLHSFLGAVLVTALWVFGILLTLGVPEVYQVSEGREGVVIHSMLETQEYILPLRHAEIVPSKPPLFHWLAGALYPLAHGDMELALRLPSALAALLLLFVLYHSVGTIAGYTPALLSCLTLLSTNGFLRLASDGRVDMLFGFVSSAGILRWLLALHRLRVRGETLSQMSPSRYRELALWSGLAILAKGPLGIVLPLMVVGSVALVDAGPRALKSLFRPQWGWAVAISAPWYLLATFKGGSAFVSRQIVFENFFRFFGGEGITKKPFWFYLEEFWGHALPWSFVILGFGIAICVERWKLRQSADPLPVFPVEPEKRWLLKVAAVWFFVPLAFYSASSGKRAAYLLTILPPLSIMLGLFFSRMKDRLPSPAMLSANTFKLGGALLLLVLGFTLLLFGLLSAGALEGLAKDNHRAAIAVRCLHSAIDSGHYVFVPLFCVFYGTAAALWLRGRLRGGFVTVFLAATAFITLCLSTFGALGQTGKGFSHGYRELAEQVSRAVAPAEQLTFIKRKKDESFDGFFYYMNRTIRLFAPGGRDPDTEVNEPVVQPEIAGLYLARVGWIHEQPDVWTKRVEQILIGGRLVDDPKMRVMLFRLKAPEPEPESVPPPSIEPLPTPPDFVLEDEETATSMPRP